MNCEQTRKNDVVLVVQLNTENCLSSGHKQLQGVPVSLFEEVYTPHMGGCQGVPY